MLRMLNILMWFTPHFVLPGMLMPHVLTHLLQCIVLCCHCSVSFSTCPFPAFFASSFPAFFTSSCLSLCLVSFPLKHWQNTLGTETLSLCLHIWRMLFHWPKNVGSGSPQLAKLSTPEGNHLKVGEIIMAPNARGFCPWSSDCIGSVAKQKDMVGKCCIPQSGQK